MASKPKAEKKSNTGMKLAFLGAVVAAAAGAYYVSTTKEGQKQMKKIRGWALKAKGEVLEKLEAFREVDEEMYNKVVDTVMKKYKDIKNINAGELVAVSKELKGHWDNIRKEIGGAAKNIKKGKNAVKSVAKRAKKAVTK